MGWPSLLQYGVFLLVVIALVKPLGGYMARVFGGEKTRPDVVLRPIERVIYEMTRVDAPKEMSWKEYAFCFIISLVGTITTYLLLRSQPLLPYFGLTAAYLTTPMTRDLAFNTALIVGGLSYFPALVLGPVVEHLLMK